MTVRPELGVTELSASSCCCCFRFFLFIFFFLFRSEILEGASTKGERDLERELERDLERDLERVMERDLTRDLLRDRDLERDLEEEEDGDDFFRNTVLPNGFVCPLNLKEIWGLGVVIGCGFNAVIPAIPANPAPILKGEFPVDKPLLKGGVCKPAAPILKPPTPLFKGFAGLESACITNTAINPL